MARRSRHAPDNLPRPSHWTDQAACQHTDTIVFFPSGKDSAYNAMQTAKAKGICGGCPVKSKCLTHALTHREDYGVWGGLDEDERADLLRRARREAENQRRRERSRSKERADAAPSA